VSTPAPNWDPAQYLQYADERSRPFVDLVARVRADAPSLVVDLGCGPGTLTRTLVARYPDAAVVGVDSSMEMIATASAANDAAAAPSEAFARLSYVCADLREWAPDGAPEVVVANAVLQWAPDHLELIGRIAGWLAPGGAFAFQVPANFDAPSHTVIRDLRMSRRWRDRLGEDADRLAGVEEPATYLATLEAAGLEPDVWQTTYLHLLPGDDPVLEWVKGTALRPVLTALRDDPAATEEFLAECGEALREAYPRSAAGTVFPFRRTFAVGHARTAA
jgi:trans-aconitate 2-methyltransferase